MEATNDQGAERGSGRVPTDLLEHAIRLWEAEVENARRLSARLNLLLPTVLAVLGLGAFNLGPFGKDLPVVSPAWTAWIVKVLLLGSLVLFMRALLLLLAVRFRTRSRAAASFRLRLPQTTVADPEGTVVDDAARQAFERTYDAAMELQHRNASTQLRIDRGQRAMLVALLHALAAVACYTLFAVGPPRSS